jgi:hypothetical protein
MDIRQWLHPALHTKRRRTYVYATQFLPLTASLTLTNEIQLKTDSYFLVLAGTMVFTDTSDATIASTANAFDKFNVPVLVTLSDSASGDALNNIAVSADNYFGSGRDPFNWPAPWLLAPGATLQVVAQNLIGTDRRMRLAFHGVRIYSTVIPGL